VVGEKQKGFNDKSMKFQQGHKFAKGGKRPGAGRPSKAQLAERESLRQAIEREREKRAGVLAARYVEMAQEDPATMRHLVDKVLPDEQKGSAQLPVLQIAFLQFGDPDGPSKQVSITAPRSAGGNLLPAPEAEEQTKPEQPQVKLKFPDFSSENGRRR
jgi:hypothetical protein